jgi:HEAT repeat protein
MIAFMNQLTNDNNTSVEVLLDLITNTSNELIRWQALQNLGKLSIGNEQAIAILIEQMIIGRTPTRRIAAQSLAKIAQGNSQTIKTLAHLAQTTSDEITREAIAFALGLIGQGNLEAINTLIYLSQNSSDPYTRKLAQKNLAKIQNL